MPSPKKGVTMRLKNCGSAALVPAAARLSDTHDAILRAYMKAHESV